MLDVCEKGAVIIIESTISPGSIDRYIRPEIEKRGVIIGEDIHLVHAPERIIPGNMIYELAHNSRTIGADSIEIGQKIANMYPFDHDALLMFAWTHFRLGKLREAEVLFNKVLMNKPDDESAAEGLELIP